MQIRGQLTFPGFRQQHNQVTLEGALSLTAALGANMAAAISNILYITDARALEAIQSYVGGNYKNLSIQHLFYPDAQGNPNIAAPAYNPNIYASAVEGSAYKGKGQMTLDILPNTESESQLECKILYNTGVWPASLDKTPILAMALILNGTTSLPSAFDGAVQNQYKLTGRELLFAFIPINSYLLYSSKADNEFAWNIYISVK